MSCAFATVPGLASVYLRLQQAGEIWGGGVEDRTEDIERKILQCASVLAASCILAEGNLCFEFIGNSCQ